MRREDVSELDRLIAQAEREIARQNAALREVLEETGADPAPFQRVVEFQPVKQRPLVLRGAVRA
jgi:8-oxo-dGTP pyrophosphatase MutT (NUDIX family)